MKKLSLLTLLAATAASMYGSCDVSGNTYYGIRPEFHSARPERVSLWRADRAKAEDCGWCASFEIVPFGGQSTRAKQLAEYFMFDGKSELTFAGNNAFGPAANLVASQPNLRDVNAVYFNLTNVFAGDVKFRPQHTFIGGGFAWRQYLGNCCQSSRAWFEVSSAIEYVRNDMKLQEKILFPSISAPSQGQPFIPFDQNACVTEAFTGKKGTQKGQAWNFGKIDGARSTTKLSDIEFKLGYDFCICNNGLVEGYVGLVVPAGNKPTGEYVFEPIVGQHHFGIMAGSLFGIDLRCCNDSTLRFELENNARYLFNDTQVRSFDVKDKPWSRYMYVYTSQDDANKSLVTPGINVFTQEVKVRPGFSDSLNLAFVWNSCNTELEVGWNVWARQCEKVTLKNKWVEGIAFARIGPDGNPTEEITLASQIGEDFITATSRYSSNFLITADDLDLDSAASPCALSHTIYAAHSHTFDGCKHPMFVGLGGSYEFSGVNTALNRWMVWGKLGVSL